MQDTAGTWTNSAVSFEFVDAYSNSGGDDFAQFYDSDGNDQLTAQPGQVRLQYSPSFGNSRVTSNGFAINRAYKTRAGSDRIDQFSGLDYLFESFGDWDIFPQ